MALALLAFHSWAQPSRITNRPTSHLCCVLLPALQNRCYLIFFGLLNGLRMPSAQLEETSDVTLIHRKRPFLVPPLPILPFTASHSTTSSGTFDPRRRNHTLLTFAHRRQRFRSFSSIRHRPRHVSDVATSHHAQVPPPPPRNHEIVQQPPPANPPTSYTNPDEIKAGHSAETSSRWLATRSTCLSKLHKH